MMFKLPELPYDYSALEPFIDEETMHLHHDKHHQAYVDNLNKALEGKDEFLNMDVKELLIKLDLVPEDIRTKVRNNAGGHANHTMFWKTLIPNKDFKNIDGELKKAINEKYGSFEKFQEEFTNKALGRFGSGWVWLLTDLSIVDTPNQDSPLMESERAILGLDVWEHAYYLKYKNVRADYIKAWWNIVNWEKVSEYFKQKPL
ncbi:MAG TPA: superoxide dismutase [Patescibacteria group bacterium]|nr:superoxide dismutase [Patescibacteria group bacterium]